MKKTEYTLRNHHIKGSLTIALVSDLHGNDPDGVLRILEADIPDLIAAPGDIGEQLDGRNKEATRNLFRFLSEAIKLAPVFYSYGNHELGACGHGPRGRSNIRRCGKTLIRREYLDRIRSMGVCLLDDEYTDFQGLRIGGLTTGMIRAGAGPVLDWLPEFCETDAYRILLCHHPEYYDPYLKKYPIDLILSGHAHGGQWRFFGQGVLAPGQGLFPKYTSGVHDDRLVISCGAGDNTWIPRFFNPHEVVYVKIRGTHV